MSRSWFKSKWLWGAVILVVIGGGYYYSQRQTNAGPFYETQAVIRGDLRQTVEVTGEVKPEARISLSFKGNGQLDTIKVKVGKTVKKGDVLAELAATDLQFSVRRAAASAAMARANLASRVVGETKESIAIAQASVDQAQASYDKAVSDLDITKQSVEDEYRISQIALDTARKNLDNSGATVDQTLQNSYDSARNSLLSALGSLQTGQIDGDAIIGVDNTSANDNYEPTLGALNRTVLDEARVNYLDAKPAKLAADVAVRALGPSSTETQIKDAAALTMSALQKTQLYLDSVDRTLLATLPSTYLTATDLSAKKTIVETDRASVSTQLSSVTTAMQTISSSDLSRTGTRSQLQNAYDTAAANLTIADHNRTTKVKAAETAVAIQEAGLASAKAALALKKAPPRDVDLAALRAQVDDATAAYEQARQRLQDVQIIAPADGIITDVGPTIGEQIAPNETVVSMITTGGYTIETQVPEADIAKVKVGQSATFTLDAYGEDVKFDGSVFAINPDQTKVQDAIYYKIYIAVATSTHDVKPGMTANVIVLTGEEPNALIIPSRAVRQTGTQKSVRILQGKTPKDVTVTLGLRGDEGRWEVTSGLHEGDIVITGELTLAEYKAQQATPAGP